jgi:hypothetical protein
MARLTVLAANLHNRRGAVTYLRNRSRADAVEHYDIGLVTEAHKRAKPLARFQGHDYLTGPRDGGTRPGRLTGNLTQDAGILLDRRLPNLGHGYHYLSPAEPGSSKIGHERWGQDVLTEFGGAKVGVVCLHPIPIMRGKNDALLARYAMAMRWLEATIAAHRHQGHEVIVGGDIQVRVFADPQHSPKPIFAEHRMDWHWHGIDVIAWTRGLQLADRPKPRVIDDFKQATGHHWLKVALEVKPKRAQRLT